MANILQIYFIQSKIYQNACSHKINQIYILQYKKIKIFHTKNDMQIATYINLIHNL